MITNEESINAATQLAARGGYMSLKMLRFMYGF